MASSPSSERPRGFLPLLRALLARAGGDGWRIKMIRSAAGSLGVTVAGTAVISVVQLLLARLLGVESFGVYTYVLAIVTLLFLLSRLGIDAALVRFVSEYRSRQDWSSLRGVLQWSERWVLGVSLSAGLVVASSARLLASRLAPELAWTLGFGGLLIPAMALVGLRQRALQGLLWPALGQAPDQILRPVLIGVFALGLSWISILPLNAPVIMGSSVVAACLAVVFGSYLLRLVLPAEARTAPALYDRKEWMRVSLPLLLVAGMWRVLHQTDILIVGTMLGTTAAGIYGVATRLARLVVLGLVAVNSITAPMISEVYAKNDVPELQRLVSFSAWCSTLVCLPGILLLVFLREFVLGLFGESFVAAGTVLVILCLGRLISALTGPTGWLLNMTGHQRVSAKIQTTVTVLNLVLNLPAVLWLGIEGAALATALAFAIQNVWTWWEVRKNLGVDGSVLTSIRAFLVGRRARA